MNDEQANRLLILLGEIAASLGEINRHLVPEAPNYRRSLGEFGTFDWNTINAQVVRRDEFGPSQVEWMDNVYTRRAPDNKFDVAIWFSRPNGKDADGNNKYDRLITFRQLADAEPLSRKAEVVLRQTPPPAPSSPPPETPDRGWTDLPSASANLPPPTAPAAKPLGPKVSPGAGPEPEHGPAKAAILKTAGYGRAFQALIAKLDQAGVSHDYRLKNGGLDFNKSQWVLGAIGYPEITEANLAEALGALEKHIIEKAQAPA
jgi:hypothetical protein